MVQVMFHLMAIFHCVHSETVNLTANNCADNPQYNTHYRSLISDLILAEVDVTHPSFLSQFKDSAGLVVLFSALEHRIFDQFEATALLSSTFLASSRFSGCQRPLLLLHLPSFLQVFGVIPKPQRNTESTYLERAYRLEFLL